jgi:hypothetical protein
VQFNSGVVGEDMKAGLVTDSISLLVLNCDLCPKLKCCTLF